MSPQRPSQPLRHKPSMRVLVDRSPNTNQTTKKIINDPVKNSIQKLQENRNVSKPSTEKQEAVSESEKSEVSSTREVSLKIAQKIKEVEQQQHRHDQQTKKNEAITNKPNDNGEAVKSVLAFWKERDAAANTSVTTNDAGSITYTAPTSRQVSGNLTPGRNIGSEEPAVVGQEETPTAPPVPPSTPIQFLNMNFSKAWSPIVIPSLPRIFSRKTDRSSTPSINSSKFDQESYHFGSEEDLGLDYQLNKPSFITEDILRNHYSITPTLDYNDYEDVIPASKTSNEVHEDDHTQTLENVSCMSKQTNFTVPNSLASEIHAALKLGTHNDYDSSSSRKDSHIDETTTPELLHDIYHSYITARSNSVSPGPLRISRDRHENSVGSASSPSAVYDMTHESGNSTPVLPPGFPSDFTHMLDNVTPDHGSHVERVVSSTPQRASLADSSGDESPVFLRFDSGKTISVQNGQPYQSSRALYNYGSPGTSSIIERVISLETDHSSVQKDTLNKGKLETSRNELSDLQRSIKQNILESAYSRPNEKLDGKDKRRTTFHTTSFRSYNRSVSDDNQGRQVPLAKRTLRKIKSVFIEAQSYESNEMGKENLHHGNTISSFSVMHTRKSHDSSRYNPLSDLNQTMLPSSAIPEERSHKLSNRINAWRVSKLRRREKPLLSVTKPKKPKDKGASLKTLVCLWRGKQVESTFSLFLSETTTSSPDQSPGRLQLAANGLSKMRNAMSLPRASKYFFSSPERHGAEQDTSFSSPASLQSAVVMASGSPARPPHTLSRVQGGVPLRVNDTPTIRTVPVEMYEAELVQRRSPSEISAVAIWHGSNISDDESQTGSEQASDMTNMPNIEIATRFPNHVDGSSF